MKKPLVTIMIPTYNQHEYIEEAIDSALEQSYDRIEIIVSDDSINNFTEMIIKEKYLDKIKYVHNKKNLGRVGNYRKLLYELSTGDFVINLDGDDYFLDEEYIAKAVVLVDKHNVDLVFANQAIGNKKNSKRTCLSLPEVFGGNWLFLNYAKNGIHIPHMTALYRRKRAISLDFYREDILSSDWESLLRYILGIKVGFLPDCVGFWRQICTQESKNGSLEDYFKNILILKQIGNKADRYFSKRELFTWKNRIVRNLILNIPMKILSCNIVEIIKFGFKNLSFLSFLSFLFNIRFFGKILIGRFKKLCVE